MDTTGEAFDRLWGDSLFPDEAQVDSSHDSLDDALVQRWIMAASKGDDEAYRKLVEYYQERIYRFCVQWLRDPEEALEATQDTFLRVYGALDRYESRGKFTTWLFQIALNQCRDRRRSKVGKQRRLTDQLDSSACEPVCPAVRPDESTARAEEEAGIHRAIDALPEKLRSVLILRGIEKLSQKRCAEILNCSERAVEGRFYRAKQVLSAKVREQNQ